MRILVVEDDATVALWTRRVFEEDGSVVDVAPTAEAALEIVKAATYDLVLVDLGLPGRDGIALVQALRAAGWEVPVLILTGRGEDAEVAAGLDAGADDFLTKPVSALVLRARVRAVVRRRAPDGASAPAGLPAPALPEELGVGDLALDQATRCARGPLGDVALTAKEYALLEFLLARAGQVIPRERLLQHGWGYQFDPGTNVVEVALSRLRRKLTDAGTRVTVRSRRGLGVVLEEASAPDDDGVDGGEP